MLEISAQLCLRIHPLGKNAGRVQLIQREWLRWMESVKPARKVQVEEEERVINDIPEFRIPGTLVPQIVGSGGHGVFEHVDGSPELAPQDGFPSCVHRTLSPAEQGTAPLHL
jgi:hypothetical protein